MESENHQQCLKIPLKVAQLLNLDMGRAYVGFVQESQNSRFFVDILSWKMVITIEFTISHNFTAWIQYL